MNLFELRYGFHLYDNKRFDNQIQLLTVSRLALIDNVNPPLHFEGNAAKPQLDTKSAVVNRFEIARAKMPVDLDRGTNDTKHCVFDMGW